MSCNPIKFKPIFKERIWGSDRLKGLFDKNLPIGKTIGESWELADLPDDCSIVSEGPKAGMTLRELLNKYGQEIGFTDTQCQYPFGLLIKFLDANDVLSVHALACSFFDGAKFKTECWYVLQAKPDAVIYRGLKPGIGRKRLEIALKENNIEQLMQVYPARKGETHFLPAGTLHALGAGVVVAEIQTPSDTTYRLYDWNRVDDQGKSRELHIKQALASIHYTDVHEVEVADDKSTPPTGELQSIGQQMGKEKLLIECPYFNIVHLTWVQNEKRQFEITLPIVMITLAGGGIIGNTQQQQFASRFGPGNTILLPKMKKGFIETDQPGECLLVCLGPKKVS